MLAPTPLLSIHSPPSPYRLLGSNAPHPSISSPPPPSKSTPPSGRGGILGLSSPSLPSSPPTATPLLLGGGNGDLPSSPVARLGGASNSVRTPTIDLVRPSGGLTGPPKARCAGFLATGGAARREEALLPGRCTNSASRGRAGVGGGRDSVAGYGGGNGFLCVVVCSRTEGDRAGWRSTCTQSSSSDGAHGLLGLAGLGSIPWCGGARALRAGCPDSIHHFRRSVLAGGRPGSTGS